MRPHAALAGAAALLGGFLAAPAAAGSGTCQRITPGEPMDGNGCGPADSAVGEACSTARDCQLAGALQVTVWLGPVGGGVADCVGLPPLPTPPLRV